MRWWLATAGQVRTNLGVANSKPRTFNDSPHARDRQEGGHQLFCTLQLLVVAPCLLLTTTTRTQYGGMIANTLNAHRLVSFAREQGKADAVMEELFKHYVRRPLWSAVRGLSLRCACSSNAKATSAMKPP